jgi:RimJ/RimL family protein N-acetyltransferase
MGHGDANPVHPPSERTGSDSGGQAPGSAHTYPIFFDLPIRTARLLLRPWRPHDESDRAVFRAHRSDPDVVRYLYTPVMSAEEADHRLARWDATITAPSRWMNLAVVLQETGDVVGDVGVAWMGDHHREAEIGYTFAPRHHGRGYATEAATAMVELAFVQLGAHRVCGRLDARNVRSARLLERLGMRREAYFVQNEWVKGEWTDEIVYAVLADEWAQSHPATDRD